jgi:hypothetical protein
MEKSDAKYLPLFAVGAAQGAWRYYVRPELTAKRAWQALAAGVVAYELMCPSGELMSEGADRAIDRYPILTKTAIGLTALHLMNALPDNMDPITVALKTVKRL